MENWFDIFGYEGLYQVSDKGRVRSLYDGRHDKERIKVLKGIPNYGGYLQVSLYDGHSQKRFAIHRLVAKAFLPDWDENLCVDHINGIRTDNRVENLRMCTRKENDNFELARENKKLAKRNSKCDYNRSKPLVKIETAEFYWSANQIGHKESSSISACCRGLRQTAYGYHWRYATEEEIQAHS